MKIGFIGAVPPAAVLPEDCIGARYQNKHAHPAPWIGGVLSGLAKSGDFELRVFVVHRAVTKRCEVERDGVVYEGVPSPLLERFAPHTLFQSKSLAVRAAVKSFQPDLIHAFGMENGSATVALRHGVPVSCFLQGIAEKLRPFYGSRSLIQKAVAVRCEAQAVRKVRWLIAETEFAKKWALEHNPEARVEVIPHPLRREFLEIDRQPEPGRIVTVGGLDARKGMDTIISAFAKLKESDTRLAIVGGGAGKNELCRLAMELGVGDRVEFVGPVDTVRVMEELARSSIYVIGSRMDTSPNVVTEAHAAGLPVVGTRAGGIPEMIDDGVDGYHVDVDDFGSMADKLEELVLAPDKAAEMGLIGKEKVRVLNDPDRVSKAQVVFFQAIREEMKAK